MTAGETDRGRDIAAVAAAMVRHVLRAAPSLRLEVTSDRGGTWLHLTYPAPDGGTAAGPARPTHELTLIDSAAQTWGHFGDTRWQTLWAFVHAAASTDSAAPGPPEALWKHPACPTAHHRSRSELVIACPGWWKCPCGWRILADGSHVCLIRATPARR
jgi:hypothetical protein